MKRIIKISSLAILLTFVACGEGVETLETLKKKQSDLKAELIEVNKKIGDKDTVSQEVVLLVTSSEVVKKDFQHKIELQGNVETDQNILINAESSGIIRKIHVKEGQKVSKGQTLITIDAEILQNTIEEVETSLEMATYMYDKQKSLSDQGLGTEIQLEQAKNQKKSLESKLKTLRSQRGKTIVRAPFSGSIDEIFTQLGEMASPQAPLIRLVNTSNIKITANVSENHLGNISLGTAVDVLFPNLNDTTIRTKISYMGNYIDPVNRTFRIHVELNDNSIFLPNQIAKIKLTDVNLDSSLVVNSQSILQDTDNNNYVYKMMSTNAKDGQYKIEKIYVNVIKSYKGESAITTEKANQLTNKSMLVLNGGKGVTDGDIVKVQ
jgi:RND family efflux transporter MFP subunit